MKFFRLVLLLVGAWMGTCAWAQQGGGPGHAPRGGGAEAGRASEREPRGQRDDLRALIRQQPRPVWEDDGTGAPQHPRQLSAEERQNLRKQLRQQRGDDWRRQP